MRIWERKKLFNQRRQNHRFELWSCAFVISIFSAFLLLFAIKASSQYKALHFCHFITLTYLTSFDLLFSNYGFSYFKSLLYLFILLISLHIYSSLCLKNSKFSNFKDLPLLSFVACISLTKVLKWYLLQGPKPLHFQCRFTKISWTETRNASLCR